MLVNDEREEEYEQLQRTGNLHLGRLYGTNMSTMLYNMSWGESDEGHTFCTVHVHNGCIMGGLDGVPIFKANAKAGRQGQNTILQSLTSIN